ncbi:MAG: hypothetical protein ABIB04_01875 [Patescibacteria group bacterium]
MKIKKIVLLFAILPFIGAGCLRIGPRIVRVPNAPTNVLVTSTGSAIDAETEKEVAYLNLSGGQAEIVRGASRSEAKDGTALYSGDRVNVTSGSVIMLYPDAGESLIEAPADFLVLANSNGQGALFTEIRLFAGSVWTRLEKLLGSEEQFSVAANGVVATVRGTAFGVSLIGDDLDIQVADHEIEITTEQEQKDFVESKEKKPVRQKVALMAGEGVKIKAPKGAKPDIKNLKDSVKKLEKAEKEKKGYVFSSDPIPPEKLKRPKKPVRLPAVSVIIPDELKQRLDLLKQSLDKDEILRGFVPPERGVTQGEYAPTGTLRELQGPTTTPLNAF